MSVRAKLGLLLLAVGGLIVIVNFVAARAYPLQWGEDPNFGRGFVQLLGYAGIVTGGALLVAAAVRRRRDSA